MQIENHIHVREAKLSDIPLIVNYWMTSSDDHLIGMGVDLNKLPRKEDLTIALTHAITSKQSYALIWELEGKAIGHTNVNNLTIGEHANMHIHLWKNTTRQKGLGTQLILASLPLYFDNLKLKTIYCEPYALNPAPNLTLEKIGFQFVKLYTTIPGSINFEQEVNQWKLTREQFDKL